MSQVLNLIPCRLDGSHASLWTQRLGIHIEAPDLPCVILALDQGYLNTCFALFELRARHISPKQ